MKRQPPAREIPIPKVHGAAALFAFITRDAKEIATHFNVSEATIKRWAKNTRLETRIRRFRIHRRPRFSDTTLSGYTARRWKSVSTRQRSLYARRF